MKHKNLLGVAVLGIATIASVTACGSGGGSAPPPSITASQLATQFQHDGLTNVNVAGGQVFSKTPNNSFGWTCYVNNGTTPVYYEAIVNIDNWTCYTNAKSADPDAFASLTGGTPIYNYG